MATTRKLEFPNRYFAMFRIATRKDLTDEQRKASFEELFSLVRQLDVPTRYSFTQRLFGEACDSKIEGLFAEAAIQWIEALEAAAKSNDRTLLNAHEHGEFHNAYLRLAGLFEQRDFALPRPHPSIAARRALKALDRAAYEHVNFSLLSFDGKPFNLTDLKGKIVLIDFWATWCPPCRDALPQIEKIHRAWRDKGLVVLGIDDEPANIVESFIARNAITYPTLLHPDRKVHNLFGVDGNGQGIPLTVVFDRGGKFVDRVPYPHTEENFLAVLKKPGL